MAATVVTWECEADGGWVAFDDTISATIEAGFMSWTQAAPAAKPALQAVPFSRSGITYNCNLSTMPMQQVRTDGQYSTARTVRRNVVQTGGSGGASSYLAGQKIVIKHDGAAAQDPEHSKRFGEAFTQFNIMLQSQRVVQDISVEYYGGDQDGPLKSAFDSKRAQFRSEGKDCTETWVFHGTGKEANIRSIMTGGFKIGGQDVPVAVGSLHGHGVYTATGPDAGPMGYGQRTQAVILCRALPGAVGAQGSSDSWQPRQDWQIFATKEQVLPCYVVRFG